MFALGKSPLGPVFRFVRRCPIICFTDEELRKLRESTICSVEEVDTSSADGVYMIGLLDPDMMDVLRNLKKKRAAIVLLKYE